MLLYLSLILLTFFLSFISKNRSKINIWWCGFIMLFICFGYMTGSDWRQYEMGYYYGFTIRDYEPGYMLLSDFFSTLKVNFWVFHIFTKCICFIVTIYYVNRLLEGQNVLLFMVIWLASFGFFLYINCPFRNLISCTIAIVAFYYLSIKRLSLYYIFSLIAISFHLSAIPLLIIPFVRCENIRSVTLVILYSLIFAVLALGGVELLSKIFSNFLPDFVMSRIIYYYDNEFNSSILSLGSIPRFLCLYLMMSNRNTIVQKYKYGNFIFNMAYLYLIFSLIYYTIPMLFRSALFLAPFYVVIIVISIVSSENRSRSLLLKYCWLFMAMAITVKTVQRVSYVPYTNIIVNVLTDDLHDYDYRDSYNSKYSPYK